MNWIERMEVFLTTSKTSTQPSNNLSFTAKPKRSTKRQTVVPTIARSNTLQDTVPSSLEPAATSVLHTNLGLARPFKDNTRLLGKY